MRVLSVGMGIAFFIATAACAVEDGDVKALVSESLARYNQFERVTSEMEAATRELDQRVQQLGLRIKWFKEPILDDKAIAHYEDEITSRRTWIARRQALIELARITEPAERAKLAEKYEADRKRLRAELLAAEKPFKKRIDELKDEVRDKETVFEEAMKRYCLWPGAGYPAVASATATAQYYSGSLTYVWQDTDEEPLAWADIKLNDRPVVQEDAETLDGAYYVSDHWPHSITAWAGNFSVHFVTVKPEWRGTEKIAGILKDFVDLEGLAKMDARRNDSSLDALAMGSLASAKRYRIISAELRAAVKPLLTERLKVNALIRRLKGPPADSDQLKEDRHSIESYKKDIRSYQERLEVGRVTDPNERAARIARLRVEAKRVYAAKKKMARPHEDKIEELKSGLKDKEAALNEAMKRYCLTGGTAYPGVTEVLTETTFYAGHTACSWKDAHGNTLCSAHLNLRNRPAVPKDAPMLDGVYYISRSGSHFIWLWVGKFRIHFEVNKGQWQGKEKIADVLEHFIDLAGLEKIN